MSGREAAVWLWVVTALWTLLSMVTVVNASLIVFHVSEELPSGTPVGNVKTSSNITGEVEEGQVDQLQFHILSADGLRITSIFSINSKTGAIFTNAMIDREQLCDLDPVCKLDFDVTVKTDVNFVKLLAVRVIVDDVNDNAPTFPKGKITLSVPESASVNSEIPISGALDKDSGLNTTIRYSLQVSSVFRLEEVKQLDGSSALKLVVQRALDRESVASYSFLILASDGQGPEAKTGTLTVGVLVTDVNDNVPQFSKDTFDMTVMETAPVGTVFGHLTASDGDVGDNGRLSYRFSLLTNSQVTDLFALNSTSGELSVAGVLQYESGKSFQCVVEVMDLGVPPQVSQAILQIHVADAGNTPPKLDLILADPVFGDQSSILSEDVQMGTFVGTLKTEDLDEGAEGQVNCSSQDSHFSLQDLETNRYGIVVSQPLDREEQQEMRIVLLCSDNGDPQLTSSTTFKVIVRDVNDNAPEFTQRVFRASVSENGAGEQYVTRVVATDDDDNTNSVITYSLDSQSAFDFTIDPLTGRIHTTESFDRELTPSITLAVYATDSGTPALTGYASLSVRIADVNDNAPYVSRSDYYVSENLPVGDVVNISVVDLDEGENGTVVASLPPDPRLDIRPFSLLANGSLRVQGRLDRERQSTYTIPLTLWDRGQPPLSSTATLTIQLMDNNDHTPLFLFPTPENNTITVMSDIPVGSHVCQISATDSDMGRNGEVTYSIAEGNSDQWLGINNQTGHVFVIRRLIRTAGSTLHLRVAASDQGTPPLVTYAFLDVFVKTNSSAALAGRDGSDEDKYVIIAGVIAGITFVVAVVVVAVIVHMRSTDLRRQAATRTKGEREKGVADKGEKLGVVCPSGVVLSDMSKHTHNAVTAEDGSLFPHGLALDNGGFESLALAPTSIRDHKGDGGVVNGDVLDIHFDPPCAAFAEGRNRLVSEDHNSDTSGESTTCDSGRGASDEEIVYPFPAKAGSTDPPPRLPPREPLAVSGQWSRDAHVVSTNWSIGDPSHYVTEEDASRSAMTPDDFEMEESSFTASDVRSRGRKGPLRVRFSFDDGDCRSQSSVLTHQGVDNQAYAGQLAHPDLIVPQTTYDPGSQSHIPLHGDKGDGPHTSSSYPQAARRHVPPRDQSNTDITPRPHGRNADTYPKESLRLNPESMYPRMDRFPRKEGNSRPSQPGWERHKTRNSESLSSLAQSVDDDASTTTSGSYSIDFDDAMNVSLEC